MPFFPCLSFVFIVAYASLKETPSAHIEAMRRPSGLALFLEFPSLWTCIIYGLLFNFASAGNFEASTVTIASLESYKLQRACAQGCLLNAGGYGYNINNLPEYLNCVGYPPLNGCYCRLDLSSSANFFISSCLTTQSCTNAVDVTSAVGVYGEYCASVSSENAGIAQVSVTTTVGGGGGVATAVVVTSKTLPSIDICCPLYYFVCTAYLNSSPFLLRSRFKASSITTMLTTRPCSRDCHRSPRE